MLSLVFILMFQEKLINSLNSLKIGKHDVDLLAILNSTCKIEYKSLKYIYIYKQSNQLYYSPYDS